jgi:hypothetical protein
MAVTLGFFAMFSTLFTNDISNISIQRNTSTVQSCEENYIGFVVEVSWENFMYVQNKFKVQTKS